MTNPEQQAVPVAQETMSQPGFVVWHSSEEDGGPDVGITVGLGDGKMLWIGERSGREGDGIGLLVYGDRAIDANASLGEYDEIRDLIEQHVAPALSRLSLPCKSGESAGEAFLDQLRRVNLARYEAWVEGADAGIMFDALELGGEVGELLNVVKKLEREERGWRGSRASSEDFADECADVLICLDKLARRKGVNLAAATIAKFNATSEKVDLPHRLSTPDATQTREAELVAEFRHAAKGYGRAGTADLPGGPDMSMDDAADVHARLSSLNADLRKAAQEAHDTLHECTAVLSASDCTKVAATMSRLRAALNGRGGA